MIVKIRDREAINLNNFDSLKLVEKQIAGELTNSIIATRYYTDSNGEMNELKVNVITFRERDTHKAMIIYRQLLLSWNNGDKLIDVYELRLRDNN